MRPQDLGAYDYAMRAMPHVWAPEDEESARALELLDKALEIDPDYPLALSLAAWCHAQRSVYNWAADEDASQARSPSTRMRLGPGSASLARRLAGQPERAIEKFERALRLSPLDGMNFNNHIGVGSAHEISGDYDRAVAFYRRAPSIDEASRSGPAPGGFTATWPRRWPERAAWTRREKPMRRCCSAIRI